MKTDVLIIGAGPAGASAALTLRHRNKTVAVVANAPESSSLYKAPLIANYPGVKLTGPEYPFKVFMIDWDREILYDRINKRVGIMIDNGLVDDIGSNQKPP